MATRFSGRDAVHREFPASPFAGTTKVLEVSKSVERHLARVSRHFWPGRRASARVLSAPLSRAIRPSLSRKRERARHRVCVRRVPSPVYGRGVRTGIRVPWDAPFERLPDATGNAPCKGPTGRERGSRGFAPHAVRLRNGVMIDGNINDDSYLRSPTAALSGTSPTPRID